MPPATLPSLRQLQTLLPQPPAAAATPARRCCCCCCTSCKLGRWPAAVHAATVAAATQWWPVPCGAAGVGGSARQAAGGASCGVISAAGTPAAAASSAGLQRVLQPGQCGGQAAPEGGFRLVPHQLSCDGRERAAVGVDLQAGSMQAHSSACNLQLSHQKQHAAAAAAAVRCSHPHQQAARPVPANAMRSAVRWLASTAPYAVSSAGLSNAGWSRAVAMACSTATSDVKAAREGLCS